MLDPAVQPEPAHDELYALRVQHAHDVEALALAADRIAQLKREIAGLIVASRRADRLH